MGEIEGYANRLRDQVGSRSGTSGGPELSGVASGLAGAASGLAGGSLASRLTGGATRGSEDHENEVGERLDLIEERLQRLEDEMSQLLGEVEVTPVEPEEEAGPEANQ